jgi:hypothetical protein
MPWQEATPMEQRERFVRDHQRGLYTMLELCARYSISRKTGYKWLDRFDEGGRAALRDWSRAPRHCPHAMPERVAVPICEACRAHPSWGPVKLLDWLAPRYPDIDWPAPSTAGNLLARHGLVKKRRRRRLYEHPGVVAPTTRRPNDQRSPAAPHHSANGRLVQRVLDRAIVKTSFVRLRLSVRANGPNRRAYAEVHARKDLETRERQRRQP